MEDGHDPGMPFLKGFSAHRHVIPTWENPELTISDLKCYMAAMFAAFGGIIEALTILFNPCYVFDVVGCM